VSDSKGMKGVKWGVIDLNRAGKEEVYQEGDWILEGAIYAPGVAKSCA